MSSITNKPPINFSAQIGELAQHQLSNDPNVIETSDWYLKILKGVLERHKDQESIQPKRYLEIACYRHIMGYQLASEYNFDSTLFDISNRDLEIGRQLAVEQGLVDNVDRVAGDFHDLPFEDNYFDFAYISASLHHTLKPHIIIGEMMRVLKEGGLFYCQREPCERLFCFYLFNANRQQTHTAMEARLQDRDTLRLFSSPFHGARNADVFSRIENDRLPLQYYYDVIARHGSIVEEALYHEGLLTRLDQEILQQEDMVEGELSDFIFEKLRTEVEIMTESMDSRDHLLGHNPPTTVTIAGMARRVAAALKARPEDKSTMQWRREMVKIFGGNLRFLVRRFSADQIVATKSTPNDSNIANTAKRIIASTIGKLGAEKKYRRNLTEIGTVKYDDAVYKQSGLNLWAKLFPEIQEANEQEIFNGAFKSGEWTYEKENLFKMTSIVDQPTLEFSLLDPLVLVIRYRVVLSEEIIAANIKVVAGNDVVVQEFIPQIEDRMMRIVCQPGNNILKFQLSDIKDRSISARSRIQIYILQGISLHQADI